MSLATLCNKNVVTVTKRASITEAAQVMRERSVGCLIVADEVDEKKKVIGILTDRDVVLEVVSKNLSPEVLTVEDIMVRNPVTANSNLGLYKAIQLMQKEGIKRLPIVEDLNYLVGILTLDDINLFLSKELFKVNSVSPSQIAKEKQGESMIERFY